MIIGLLIPLMKFNLKIRNCIFLQTTKFYLVLRKITCTFFPTICKLDERFKYCTQKRSLKKNEEAMREELKERDLVATCKCLQTFFSISFTMSCREGHEDALSLHRFRRLTNSIAGRARQRETKADICESKHCN